MKTKQRVDSKKIANIFLALIFCATAAAGQQVSGFRLKQADSLFKARQYVQSVEHYQAILDNKQYTPAMLLKMAYVHEGLKHTGQTLYCLNLYYLATKDRKALDKMEALATKFGLEGYKNSDFDLALAAYQDYHLPVSAALAAVIVFLLSFSFYLKKRKRKPVATMTLAVLFMILMLAHVNAGDKLARAILINPHTYAMSGPSSGAQVVSVLPEGHRVEVVGKHDVWLEVKWNDQNVYIREGSLLPVSL
jgi:hypothetical protein